MPSAINAVVPEFSSSISYLFFLVLCLFYVVEVFRMNKNVCSQAKPPVFHRSLSSELLDRARSLYSSTTSLEQNLVSPPPRTIDDISTDDDSQLSAGGESQNSEMASFKQNGQRKITWNCLCHGNDDKSWQCPMAPHMGCFYQVNFNSDPQL